VNEKLIIKVMKRKIFVISIVLGLIVWSCSKVDTQTQPTTLRQALNKNVTDINTAISKISSTKGYQVLSATGDPVARVNVTGPTFKDSISLALVAGIYDYQFDTIPMYHRFEFPYRLFKKTGTSDMMIVNLPEKMIFHPRYLHSFLKPDSILKNDFTITASNYHLFYNSWNNLDYKLTAGLTLKGADLGSFDISAVSTTYKDQVYSSEFTFTGGYSISTSWQAGDTAKSTFALYKDTSPLLLEKTLFAGIGFHRRERQYDLTIGNIEIKRGFGIDSIQVFQNGVLQKKAGARITDSPDSTGSIFNRRDILLTFDDGTTANLSTLIGPALTQLKSLFTSLHDMYFAENIVDYIAVNIYFNSR
jgi:hypothetical protein